MRALAPTCWLWASAILALWAGCGGEVPGPNQPPVAVAGPDRTTEVGTPVLLDGASSWDPDGDAIADYMWTFGEDVEILTPLEFSKTVTVPILLVRYPEEGAYTVELLVVDEHGLMADPPPFTMQVVVPSIPVEPMS